MDPTQDPVRATVSAYNRQATTLMQQGRHREAIQVFDQAIQLLPGSPATHFNRGNALLALQALDQAQQSYETAIQLKPDYARAMINLAVGFRGVCPAG